MADDVNHGSQSAIKIIERVPKAGYEDKLEKVIEELGVAMHQSPGFSSSHVIRPSPPEQQAYRIVCLFDSEQHLRAWEASDVHTRLIEVANQFTEGKARLTWLTGLESWFTLPVSANAQGRPPIYKMAITTFVALFPTIQAVVALLGLIPGFAALPPLLGAAVATAMVVALMTYVIMPRFTRLLAFWLYPNRDGGH
ncbi:MAG: antibiotic biosynthesis monooxygenase [Pseudomonadota bacterium]